jgi:hypothetical protein
VRCIRLGARGMYDERDGDEELNSYEIAYASLPSHIAVSPQAYLKIPRREIIRHDLCSLDRLQCSKGNQMHLMHLISS